jgi:hypothetical protein
VILREFLPERSAEDITAGRIRLTFGVGESARPVDLFVLPINANRAWKEKLEKTLGGVWEGLDGVADPSTMLAWLADQDTSMLDLLQAYDIHGVLPDKAWIEDHATNQQVLTAFLGVCAAAHPLAVSVIEAISSNSDLMRMALIALSSAFSAPTSSAPASTGGSPKRSKKS